MTNSNSAERLAADLAGAQVDPNEAQKALAYLRSVRDPKRFFDYLRAINNDGRAVIRSNQTLGYYRELLAACERHLRGLGAQEMAYTLGWAIRLLRYYRMVPGAPRPEVQRDSSRPESTSQRLERPREEARSVSTLPDTTAQPITPPKAPTLPEVGAVFTGKVLDGDDEAYLIGIPGFEPKAAIAVLRLGPGVPKYRLGKDSAKVEVAAVKMAKGGRTILEVKRPER